MLRQSLKSVSPIINETLHDCAIKETARAEELTIDDFVKIAAHIK